MEAKISSSLSASGSDFLPKAWRGIRGIAALSVYLEAEASTKLLHKRKRYLLQSMMGIACGIAKGYRFRSFVLTESDEALAAGVRFDDELHRFFTWLRYYCSDFQYSLVEHMQGKPSIVTGLPRLNRHVLSYGSDRLPLESMREYWQSHYLSTISGMREEHDLVRTARYLAGYLGREHKFVRAWTSQGWVYPGWLRDSREFRLHTGHYPAERELVTLALMSPASRVSDPVCTLLKLEDAYYHGLSELYRRG